MGIKSINEPDGPGRTTMVTPVSINEPPQLPEGFGTPVIDALDPAECVIGDADFTLKISGTEFYAGSVINFAGYDEPTTLNEDGTLSTGVKPSLWANPAVVPVFVHNIDKTSNSVEFTFAAAQEDPAEASQGVTENVSRERSSHGHAGSHGRGGRSSRR